MAEIRLRDRLGAWRAGDWNRSATTLTVLVLVLVLIGLMMSFSASFVDAAEGGDPFGVFQRQLVWAGIGVPVFFLVAGVDHRRWRTASWVLVVVSLVGLGAVLVPGIGVTRGGSTRWIALGPTTVQPTELAKLATLVWLGDVYARKRALGLDLQRRTSHLLVPALPLLAIEVVLIMRQPDLGTALLLALVVGLVVWAAGLRLSLFGGLAVTGGTLAVGAALLAPYRAARIAGWLDPVADPQDSGYQLLQSLYALGSGRWFGVGLGAGRAKWNYVPNPESDFIFAVLGEELGLVGALVVLALFLALLLVGNRVARQAPDHFGRVCALALTGWIVGQALVNMGTVTGLLPITGVTLPLVSVGGSSLLSTLVALGLLVAIARSTDESESTSDLAENTT